MRPYDVAVRGHYAYLADNASGLLVIDVSDPQNPQIVGSVDTAGYARGVAVSGGPPYTCAYVADSFYGLQVIDVTYPQYPQIIGTEGGPCGANAVVLSGDQAYLSAGYCGLQVIDITDPQSPRTLGCASTPPPPAPAVIRLTLAAEERVRITIYDATGRQVRSMHDETLDAGTQDLSWDGRDDEGRGVAAGLYLARVSTA